MRVYGRLMDRATDAPIQELRSLLRVRVEAPVSSLAEEIAEMLRAAYVEGCRDGYAEAVRDAEGSNRGD